MNDLRVRNLMTDVVETLEPDDDLDLAEMMMRLDRIRHLPVVAASRVVGIVSHRDVLRSQVSSLAGLSPEERRKANMKIRVSEIMTRDVVSIGPEEPMVQAAMRMRDRRVGSLVVLENDELIGIITESDFLDYVIRISARGI